jgi:hypothetical protein
MNRHNNEQFSSSMAERLDFQPVQKKAQVNLGNQ